MPALTVKAGRVDLLLDSGHTLVLPSDYGLVHDGSGDSLDKCSLFFAPVEVTDEVIDEVSDDAREWFGDDYELHRASVDVPGSAWELHGHVVEIVYFRPGAYEDDWRHGFESPQPLYVAENDDGAICYMLELDADCVVNWRGIVRP